jgi:hypothetical protein
MVYFPLLRSKTNELVAIKESAEILKQGNVIPIVEPIKELGSFPKYISDNDIPCFIIVNPFVGDIISSSQEIILLLSKYKNIGVAFNLDNRITAEQLKYFFATFSGYAKMIIHYSERLDLLEFINRNSINYNVFNMDNNLSDNYCDKFLNETKVILKDSFEKKSTNEDYRETPQTFYSYCSLLLDNNKIAGFSDYVVIGKDLTTGFTPKCVALHITSFDSSSDQIFVNHYVSEIYRKTQDPKEVAEKYIDAKNKFNDDFRKRKGVFLNTKTLDEFYSDDEYHGLGFPKKISIEHHIEFINTLIAERKRT